MKKEITGYISGVINSYTRTIDRLNKLGIVETSSFVAFKEEFSDLLEFVIDIPEDKELAIINFNMALEERKIKGTNEMLEKTCDGFREENCKLVQEQQILKEKLKAYECNDAVRKNIYEELKAENKRLSNCTLDKKHELTIGRV